MRSYFLRKETSEFALYLQFHNYFFNAFCYFFFLIEKSTFPNSGKQEVESNKMKKELYKIIGRNGQREYARGLVVGS